MTTAAGVVRIVGATTAVLLALAAPATADAPAADSVCTLDGALVPAREPDVWSVSARFACASTAEGGIDDVGVATGRLVFSQTDAQHGAVALDLTLDLARGSLRVDADGPVTTVGLVSSAVNRGLLRGESGLYLNYLGVWEATITAVEDPELSEKALGGPVDVRRVRPHDDD